MTIGILKLSAHFDPNRRILELKCQTTDRRNARAARAEQPFMAAGHEEVAAELCKARITGTAQRGNLAIPSNNIGPVVRIAKLNPARQLLADTTSVTT